MAKKDEPTLKDQAKQFRATVKSHLTGTAGAGAGEQTTGFGSTMKRGNSLARQLEAAGLKGEADSVRKAALSMRPKNLRRGVTVK